MAVMSFKMPICFAKKSLGKMQGKAWPSRLWKSFSLCWHDTKFMEHNTLQNQAHHCSPQPFKRRTPLRSGKLAQDSSNKAV